MSPEEVDARLDIEWLVDQIEDFEFCEVDRTDDGVRLINLDIEDVPDDEMVWLGEVKKNVGGVCKSKFRIYGDGKFIDLSKKEVLKCIDGHVNERIVKHLNLDNPESAQKYPEDFDYYFRRAIQDSFDRTLN